ncbi:hypothetical protein [Candidatus Pantoea persica]|nr:hypothetical protein [Candidatus Pantoea persica]
MTSIAKPPDEHVAGELALLSMYGKLEAVSENGKIKASYPIDIPSDIQKI